MTSQTFFFDTYALFEVLQGNPLYQKYGETRVITTWLNLAEFNYNLKKEKDKKTADTFTEKYRDSCVVVTLEDVKAAMDLKIQKKDLSIPDVIGYIVAKRYKVKFLTGDEGFRSMDNVEFVK